MLLYFKKLSRKIIRKVKDMTKAKRTPKGFFDEDTSYSNKVHHDIRVPEALNENSLGSTKVCSKCKRLKSTFSFSNRGKYNTKLRASCKLCEQTARLERDALNKAIKDELNSNGRL